MKRFLLAAGTFSLLTLASPMPARAHTDFSFSFGFPGLAFFAPPPPVVYYERPAYYAPAPVYYAPVPVYRRPCHRDRRWHDEWQGHGLYRGWHGR